MYRVVTNITIKQIPTVLNPTRTFTMIFNFCNTYEASSSWRDLTNSGRVILPKALYFKDAEGALHPLAGHNPNVGGFTKNQPLILRGDQVTITAGYGYFNRKNDGRETFQTATLFNGFVSKVTAAQPIEFEIEDNMWLFKQTPVVNKIYKSTDSVETVMIDMVNQVNAKWKTNFTHKVLTSSVTSTKLNASAFGSGSESAAQVLNKLQKLGFEFYFNGNQLRGGTLVYIEAEAKTGTFEFQKNIISDDLTYMRLDDIKLSAIVHNTIIALTGKTTKDGKLKTKRKRIEVLVTMSPTDKRGYSYRPIRSKEDKPLNDDGERREFYMNANTEAELAQLGYEKLKVYYYEGLRGEFTTFGLPFMQMGDNAVIIDKVMPERGGTYKIKKVEYSGGVAGLRQKISLDFRFIS